jgi:hypothetical protein
MEFKAHDPKRGLRLYRQIRLGPPGLSRGFAPAASAVEAKPPSAAKGISTSVKGRGGRPRTIEGRPWLELGISRRTWERRRKEGAARRAPPKPTARVAD